MSSIFATAIIFLLSSFLVFQLLRRLRLSTSTATTPPTYPIIGCLLAFYKNRRRLLDWYTDLLASSPTQTILIRRLGDRPSIITANPANVQHMLKSNFPNYPKGKPINDILGDLLGAGIFNADGPLWAAQRKLASHAFKTSSLRHFIVKTLTEVVDRHLLPLLDSSSDKNVVVLDLQDVLKRFTFDSICKVALGTDPYSLDLSKPLPEFVRAFEEASDISTARNKAPVFLIWKLKRFFNVGSERKLRQDMNIIHHYVTQIVNNRKQGNADSKNGETDDGDLLSLLMSSSDFDDTMVRDIVLSFILAGRDTTAASMTWLFWLLSKHPKAEQRILREVDESGLDKNHRALEYDSLKEMHYLKACLCETMRLYPPVAWDTKVAAAGDTLPDGTRVAAGDRVTFFPYGMGRMDAIWGSDRYDFRPERWLERSGEVRPVDLYKWPVFQAGPRVCLGKEMAFVQMRYVVASVLKRFWFEPMRSDRPVFVPKLTAHMDGGLPVRVHMRY